MTSYSYNVRNELVQTDDVNFGYDIDGIRNSKAKNGVTVDYITDKNRDYAQVILEKQNNTPVASYSYGDDLISQNVNGTTSYFGYDGLGSTKFLTNQVGQITDSYQYDAYGEITDKTGNTDNIYLYTGEQFDRSLNQYYPRARYYDQGVGRFTQMDSWQGIASNPTTLNKYLYANANPIMNIDPTGNFSLGGMMSGLNGFATLSSMSYRTVSIGRTVLGAVTGPIISSTATSHVSSGALASLIAVTAVNYCINNDSCKSKVPILIYGYNHKELTKHIFDAQLGAGSNSSPAPSMLTYNPSATRKWMKTVSRGVYSVGGECYGSNRSKHCDEYPFNKSHEGGGLNYDRGMVSLRLINGSHNSGGGGVFGRMVQQDGTANHDKFLVFASNVIPKSLYLTRKGKVGF